MTVSISSAPSDSKTIADGIMAANAENLNSVKTTFTKKPIAKNKHRHCDHSLANKILQLRPKSITGSSFTGVYPGLL